MFAAASLTRRSALASAVLTPVLLTACDIDPPASTTATGSPTPPPEDSEVVASMVRAIGEAMGMVSAVRDAFPALSDQLEPLALAHAAHLNTLAGALPDSDASSASPAPLPLRAGALNTVQRGERRLLRTLRESCVSAASGDLARLLASMDASISQHLVALTRRATP